MTNYLKVFENYFKRVNHPLIKWMPLIHVVLNLLALLLVWRWPLVAALVLGINLMTFTTIDLFRRRLFRSSSQFRQSLEDWYHAGSYVEKVLKAISRRDFSSLDVDAPKAELHQDARHFIEVASRTGDRMRAVVDQLQELSSALGRVAQKILASTGEQASASSEQAASVAEITATMEELAKTAAQIAQNADDVNQVAAHTENSSSAGFDAAQNMIQKVSKVKGKIDTIQSNAKQLGEKSTEINKILNLITEIANETHLLALNASIESVAAGEYGKRFGVVAMEVRRLAERSSESVEHIRSLLEHFQDSIHSTILSTEEGVKEVDLAVSTAERAVSHFADIQNLVSQNHNSAREISIATQQQQTASEQIVLTLKEISEVSNQSASNLNDSTQAAEDLNRHAEKVLLFAQTFIIAKSNNIKYILMKFRDEGFAAASPSARSTLLRDFLSRHPFVEALFVADSGGELSQVSVSSRLHVNTQNFFSKNYSDRPWFRNAMEKQASWVTDPYLSVISQELCFTVSVPVLGEKRKTKEILAADINMKQWNEIG
jgi:methyl-accepting chemotaxis protein